MIGDQANQTVEKGGKKAVSSPELLWEPQLERTQNQKGTSSFAVHGHARPSIESFHAGKQRGHGIPKSLAPCLIFLPVNAPPILLLGSEICSSGSICTERV